MKLSNEKDTEILNINLFNFNSTNIIEKIDNDIVNLNIMKVSLLKVKVIIL